MDEEHKLITHDSAQVSGGKLDPVDEEIANAAATGEGLIQVTPEMLEELAEAAKATVDHFQKVMENMTKEQADYVRQLRVDEGYSWRAVASACNEAWNGDWDSNQIAGMAICEKAASFFDEDYFEKPWN